MWHSFPATARQPPSRVDKQLTTTHPSCQSALLAINCSSTPKRELASPPSPSHLPPASSPHLISHLHLCIITPISALTPTLISSHLISLPLIALPHLHLQNSPPYSPASFTPSSPTIFHHSCSPPSSLLHPAPYSLQEFRQTADLLVDGWLRDALGAAQQAR